MPEDPTINELATTLVGELNSKNKAVATAESCTGGWIAKALVNNWLGLVYQLTNLDRRLQYMDGVDPADPLGMKTSP